MSEDVRSDDAKLKARRLRQQLWMAMALLIVFFAMGVLIVNEGVRRKTGAEPLLDDAPMLVATVVLCFGVVLLLGAIVKRVLWRKQL